MTDTSLTKAIDSQTHSVWQQLYRSQPFWVTIAAIGLCVVLSWAGTNSRGEQVFFTAQTTQVLMFAHLRLLGAVSPVGVDG